MQNTFLLKASGYILGAVGTIIVFCGGLVSYIFKSAKKQNDAEHSILFDKAGDHSERISKIEGKLKL